VLLQNAIDAGYVQVQKPDEKGVAMRAKIKGVMEDLGKKWKGRSLVRSKTADLNISGKSLNIASTAVHARRFVLHVPVVMSQMY